MNSRKVRIALRLLGITAVFAGNSSYAYQQNAVDFGTWVDPLAHMTTDPCCSYDSAQYRANWSVGHTGIDLGMGGIAIGDSVKAIGAGVIVARKRHCNINSATLNESVVLVRHQTASGASFIAVYGHTIPTGIACDGSRSKYTESYAEINVVAGEEIGTVAQYGDPHLHFGISVADRDTVLAAWGRYSGTTIPADWRNPEVFLQSNMPSSSVSAFDGAGSLVDPGNGGSCSANGNFGCSRDTVRLHHHENQNSAGFFQVVGIPGVCEAVRLEGLTYASVEVRDWDSRGTGSTFYRLSALPAVINLPSSGPSRHWFLIGVQTVSPVPKYQTRSVTATCLPGRVSDPNVQSVSPGSIMTFDADYKWGGNGSLISFSSANSYTDTNWGFGRTKDTVVLLNNSKTLSVFQVAPSSVCNSITFSTPVPIEVSWKPWDSEAWTGTQVISTSGTVAIPTGNPYWLFKVKPMVSTNNAIVDASCSPW